MAGNQAGRVSAEPSIAPERLEAAVSGLVQGVGFRYFVLRESTRLGLTGWVANRSDGSVCLLAEGPRADLDRLAERLSIGPPGAGVTDVELARGPATGAFRSFTIRSGTHPGD